MDNRKRYPLKGLKLLYSADGQANRQLIHFEAPPSGQSKHPFRFPDDPAKVLSFVVCQNERRVSQIVELGSDQDARLQPAPAKPGAWGSVKPEAKAGAGVPSAMKVETSAKNGMNANKSGVSTVLYQGPNTGGPLPGFPVPPKGGSVVSSSGPVIPPSNPVIPQPALQIPSSSTAPKPGSIVSSAGPGVSKPVIPPSGPVIPPSNPVIPQSALQIPSSSSAPKPGAIVSSAGPGVSKFAYKPAAPLGFGVSKPKPGLDAAPPSNN